MGHGEEVKPPGSCPANDMVADVLTRPLLSACEQHFAVSLGCARPPFRLIYLIYLIMEI